MDAHQYILVFVLSCREGIIEISVRRSTYLRSVVGCNALPGSINVVVVVDEILFSVRTLCVCVCVVWAVTRLFA